MIRKLTLVALCCLLLLGLAVAPAAAGNAAGVPVWAPAWLSGAKALSATITASPTHGVPGSEVIGDGQRFRHHEGKQLRVLRHVHRWLRNWESGDDQ